MNVPQILSDLSRRGIRLYVEGDELRYVARRGVVTAELKAALAAHKPDIVASLTASEPPPSVDSGEIVAVLVRSAILDNALVWVVKDASALDEHPDIVASGHPIFFFDEIEKLRGKPVRELQAIYAAKRSMHRGAALQ